MANNGKTWIVQKATGRTTVTGMNGWAELRRTEIENRIRDRIDEASERRLAAISRKGESRATDGDGTPWPVPGLRHWMAARALGRPRGMQHPHQRSLDVACQPEGSLGR